jgi:hypothetical protein
MLQIESVLHKILHELKVLYARHAPQLKPRKTSTGKSSSSSASSATASSSSSSNSSSEQLSSDQLLLPDPGSGCNGGAGMVGSSSSSGAPCLTVAMSSSSSDDAIDPVTDMYNILEGSALIPFAEVSYSCTVLRFTSHFYATLRWHTNVSLILLVLHCFTLFRPSRLPAEGTVNVVEADVVVLLVAVVLIDLLRAVFF